MSTPLALPATHALIKILILEDNRVVAQRLTRILQDWGRGEVVAQCETLAAAINVIQQQPVDLLIADIHLNDGSGIDAIRVMRETQPNGCSVVISSLSQRSWVIDALRAGALGYLLKDDDSVGIVQAVEAILDGQSPISIGIARYLIDNLHTQPGRDTSPADQSQLTAREIDVLNAIAKGFTNREIAEIMGISAQTVPVHVRNIYRKLQVSNRTEAAYEAHRLGMTGHD